MLVFHLLFLKHTADWNWKKNMPKTSIATNIWPILFCHGFNTQNCIEILLFNQCQKNHYLSSLKVIFQFFFRILDVQKVFNVIFVILSCFLPSLQKVFLIQFYTPDKKFTSVTFIVKNAMFPSNLFWIWFSWQFLHPPRNVCR